MILDPENPFEILQNEVAAKLEATPPFDAIDFPDGQPFKVLTEDEGDIQFQFDTMISVIGLSMIVQSPIGRIEQPDIPGPLISSVQFDIWASEAPLLNRSTNGTGVRLIKAMTIILGAIHGFQPASLGSPVYATGFDKFRERVYAGTSDDNGILIVSRIIHFICPLVAAEITT